MSISLEEETRSEGIEQSRNTIYNKWPPRGTEAFCAKVITLRMLRKLAEKLRTGGNRGGGFEEGDLDLMLRMMGPRIVSAALWCLTQLKRAGATICMEVVNENGSRRPVSVTIPRLGQMAEEASQENQLVIDDEGTDQSDDSDLINAGAVYCSLCGKDAPASICHHMALFYICGMRETVRSIDCATWKDLCHWGPLALFDEDDGFDIVEIDIYS